MKKLVLSLFSLLLFATVLAQNYSDLITADISVVKSVADGLALNAQTKYTLKSAAFDKFDSSKYVVSYVCKTAPDKGIAVSFLKATSLDHKPIAVPLYLFNRVEGALEDLFPFWNRYIDKDATIESVKSANKAVKILDFDNGMKMEYHLAPNLGGWQITRKRVN